MSRRRLRAVLTVSALVFASCHGERPDASPLSTRSTTEVATVPKFVCIGEPCDYEGPRGFRGEVHCVTCDNVGSSTWVSDELPEATLIPLTIVNVSPQVITLRTASFHHSVDLEVESVEVAGPQPEALAAVAVMGYPPSGTPLGLHNPALFVDHPISPISGFGIPPASSPYDATVASTAPNGLMIDGPNQATLILRVSLPPGVEVGWYLGIDVEYDGPTGRHVARFGEIFGGVCRARATPPGPDETCDAIGRADRFRHDQSSDR